MSVKSLMPTSQTHHTTEFPELTHRQILEVLSGLLVALLVTNMAGTVVGTALPRITAQLGASEQQYMWVVTATLLASTASTPIWGKLADLFDKKHLIMIGLVIFIAGSTLSGAAGTPAFLIASRAFQGIGLGAMQALVQAIIGSIIPPRSRGRYMAYTGAVMAIATVGGPLVGGFIVDTSWLGWRWCFWSAIPFAIAAIVILQWRLRVPRIWRNDVKIDWLGAALITAAVSAILIWISFVTKNYAWFSWQTFAMLGFALVAAVAFVITEAHAHNPIIPLPIIRMRVTALAVLASISVGIAMFGASVFLAQYFQLGRNMSPTRSGLMLTPMMIGVLISSLFIGRLVSRLGIWKPFVVAGAVLLTVGGFFLSTINATTSLMVISIYMVFTGFGVGMLMQNLVLAVQNSISIRDVGAATGTVTFFRSLGGAVGIQALGFVFEKRMTGLVQTGIPGLIQQAVTTDATANPSAATICAALAQNPTELAQAGAQCPHTAAIFTDMASLQATGGGTMDMSIFQSTDFRDLLLSSIANSIGRLFLIASVVSAISIIIVLFMKPTRLRTHFGDALPDDAPHMADDDQVDSDE
ncbi:MAG: MFS transporter [Propionibacteriaceae bacterium]|nr:MFS transporter [Propionibacteriaceae bacterium]